MIFFLTSHSLWLSGFIIIGLGTLLATLGPSVVRHFVTLDRLTTNNEIAGFKFATVGVLYAVLLAFAIIVVWQKYSDAETTVAQEAGAAAAIFQLSGGIDEKPGAALRARAQQLSGARHRRRLAGHGAGRAGRKPVRAAGPGRGLHGAADVSIEPRRSTPP